MADQGNTEKRGLAAGWLTREELTDVEWLPADVAVAEKIEEEMD